jgi:hypothetical protein
MLQDLLLETHIVTGTVIQCRNMTTVFRHQNLCTISETDFPSYSSECMCNTVCELPRYGTNPGKVILLLN